MKLSRSNITRRIQIKGENNKFIYIDPSASVNGRGKLNRPYNSFSEVNNLTGNLGGRTIYIKKGTSIEGQLFISNASNFVVDTYGTGDKPIIDGSRSFVATWTVEGSLWYTAVESGKDYSRAFWVNGTHLLGQANKTDLNTGTYKCWYDSTNHRHYLTTDGVINPNTATIKANSQASDQMIPVYLFGCSDCRVSNLQAQRGYRDCLTASDCGNNVEVSYNNAIDGGGWSPTTYSQDGIRVYGGTYEPDPTRATGIYIHHNFSSGNVNNGIEVWGLDGGLITENSGDGNCGGIEIWGQVINSRFTRNKFINNYGNIYATASNNPGRGIWATPANQESPNTGNFSGNTLAYNIIMNSSWTNLWIHSGTGWKIYNNIFHEVPTLNYYTIIIDGVGTEAEFSNNIVTNLHGGNPSYPLGNLGTNAGTITLTGNNNCYYQYIGDGTYYTRINFNGTLYQNNMAGFRSATGQTNSVNVNPLYVSSALATYDFSLQPGSPLIDAGVAVGETVDYLGNAVGTPPTIGSYESDYTPASSLDLNFAEMADGAIASLLSSGYTVSGGKAINSGLSAGLGTEKLTDPGFEDWTTDTNLTSWTETVASTSTVNKESTEKHSGNFAVNFNINASGSAARISQATVVPQYSWVVVSAWAKNNVGTNKSLSFLDSAFNAISGYSETAPLIGNSTTISQYLMSYISLNSNSGFCLSRTFDGATSSILYADDVSQKIAPVSSIVDVALFSSQYGSIKAAFTRPSNFCLMGVVMCLDYPNNTNYVVAYHDTVNLFLKKFVGGTQSTLVKVATTYIPGANIMIKRAPSGNVFQLWYGPAGSEAQVGTDQTVTDATIINNRHHGLFDLSPGVNQCSRFIYSSTG